MNPPCATPPEWHMCGATSYSDRGAPGLAAQHAHLAEHGGERGLVGVGHSRLHGGLTAPLSGKASVEGRALRSGDPRRAVAPVAILQDALVELAGRQARHLVDKVDRAR